MTQAVSTTLDTWISKLGKYPEPQFLVIRKLAPDVPTAQSLIAEHIAMSRQRAMPVVDLPPVLPGEKVPEKEAIPAKVGDSGTAFRYLLISLGCFVIVIAGVIRSFSYVKGYFAHEGNATATISAIMVVGVTTLFLQVVKEIHVNRWKNWLTGAVTLLVAFLAIGFAIFATVRGMYEARSVVENQGSSSQEAVLKARAQVDQLNQEEARLLRDKVVIDAEAMTLQKTLEKLTAEGKLETDAYYETRNRIKLSTEKIASNKASLDKLIEDRRVLQETPGFYAEVRESSTDWLNGIMGENFEFNLNLIFACILETVVPIAVLAIMDFGGKAVAWFRRKED